MSKPIKGARLQFLAIEKSISTPIYRQIESQIRNAILTGIIKPGLLLPASRVLAQDLGVSRPTMVRVYEYLSFEGFLETRHGSGTFVSRTLPDYLPHKNAQPENSKQKNAEITKPLSKIGKKFNILAPSLNRSQFAAFLPNVPAFDRFPFARWQKIRDNCLKADHTNLLGYEDSSGHMPLRRSIAEYLAVHRGDVCDPEQILIVPGATAAFHLAVMLLSNPGDKVWLEDPGPDGVRAMLMALGRNIINLDVEADGMDVQSAIQHNSNARLAFTMPSRQHPLGVTLSLTKRMKLLDWASKNRSWIIEDDYDSEFRYSGRPLGSMRSIDTTSSVIYVGTFSKSLFPSLRIGYLVLPENLIGTFRSALGTISRSISILDQATLARFIDEGYFTAHIRQMQNLYSTRRASFIEIAKKKLSGLLDIEAPDSGINVIGWLPKGTDDLQISKDLRDAGIHTFPLSLFRARPSNQAGLVMGFAGTDRAETVKKMALLASVLEKTNTFKN
ncbi:MAG: GntR family transcriptional regulator [Hyphomicrobiales bacterium]|nr:MAG: GntR family transcriptional regulator [Hyphomicrobiales bacterium]